MRTPESGDLCTVFSPVSSAALVPFSFVSVAALHDNAVALACITMNKRATGYILHKADRWAN